MLAWWDVFGDSGTRRLRALAFYEGDELVGLAPLLVRPHVHRPRLPFRRLELLASGEDEADETCSEYLGVLAARGHERTVAAALANALGEGPLRDWDELILQGMSAESELVPILQDELARRRLLVSLSERDQAPYIALPPTFDAYLAALDAEKRAHLVEALAALESWAGATPVLEHARSADRLAEAWRVLEAVHRERHPDGGPYRSERFRRFHERVMPRLLERGALDVGWLAVRGKPVAAFYNLRWNGQVWHYLSAHARDVPDDVHIGVTLQALLLRAAIEDGMREYDFLAGILDYKMALADRTRRLVTLRAARPSLVESARGATSLATKLARRVLKR